MNILVLCTGNSARSILLETILSELSDGRIKGFSAGSKPAGKVHPQSLKLLSGLNFPTKDLRSKSWDEFAGSDAAEMDCVITVCGSAAAETCPFWPTTNGHAPVQAHWGIPDPAAAAQPDWDVAFETAFDSLSRKAAALMALPIETMAPVDLKTALNQVATV